jgi:hypothetical protein
VALRRLHLGDDLLFVLGQRLRERRETLLQLAVVSLAAERLRPIQGQVEMAASIVELAGLRRRRLVVVEQLAGRLVERLREDLRLVVVGLDAEVLERYSDREEFAE